MSITEAIRKLRAAISGLTDFKVVTMKQNNTGRQHVTLRLAPDLVRQIERETIKLERRTGIRPSRSAVIEKYINIGLNGGK